MNARTILGLAALTAALAGSACESSRTPSVLAIEAAGRVQGRLFLDLNGNAKEDTGDTPIRGWVVQLVGGNGAVVGSATSDSTGAFAVDEVPTGHLLVSVDRVPLGDTLEVFGLALGRETTLGRGDTLVVSVGFTFPKVSLAALDTVRAGRRVFVEGVALNPITSTGPRELHIRAGGDAARITNLVRTPVNPGDSVRVLARRANEAGQVILTAGQVTLLGVSVADPQPRELTTKNAASAQDGVAREDLVRIRNADLVRSRNELNDVVLTVDDGTGQLEILIRSFLGADSSFFKPDSVRVQQAAGLLVPYLDDAGKPRWRLATRSALDLRLEAERPRTAGPADVTRGP